MADAYKGLTVKLGVDTTGLSSALRKVRSETSGVSKDLRAVERALKMNPGNVKLLAQQQRDYQRQIEATKKELELFKQAEKELESLDAMTPEQEAQWAKLQSDIVMTEQKLKGYKQALAESMVNQGVAESSLGKLGATVERFGSHVQGFGDGMQTVGRTLTSTLTPAVIGVGAATVAAAVDIDTALTGVKKTVDGTDEQYQQLKDSAIEFSKTNAVSASQILDIQALGAQLGFAIEELDEFGQVVSGLDIATNMDAETAATEMAQFANITKMSHGEISNYGSAIVGLGNNFATTESDISRMAMRIAAAGTQVHMSQADILGLATALSSMGVEAEAGGTAISTIMAQIDKDIATNSESVETWASTAGMSAQDFAAAWKNDPVQALSALLSNMEAATAEGGNMSVMLQELGIDSIRQTDVMKRLAGNSQFVADAVSKANEEWGKNTALQDEVDNRNGSLAAQFEVLKNRVIAVADDVGGPLAEALLDALDAASPLIEQIASGAKAFADMSKEEQQSVLKTVALVAAMGPLLTIFGKGISDISSLGKGLQGLAKFFATLDLKTSSAGRALRDYDTKTKAVEKSTKASTTAIKASSVAMGAAKAAAIGLAIEGIALVIGEIVKYVEHQKKLDEATNGLKSSVGSMNDAYLSTRDAASVANGAADGYSQSLSRVSEHVDEVIEKQAELASSIKETLTEAGKDIGLLDSYKDTIDELAGKSDLSAEKQAELQLAIEGVNDKCGTNYEVVRDAGGAYVIMKDGAVEAKDAVLALVDAQELQMRLDADKEAYEQLYKSQADAVNAAAEAQAAYNDVLSKHDENVKQATGELGSYELALATVQEGEDAARAKLDEANQALSASKDATALLKDEQLLLAQATSDGADGISKYVAGNDFLLASLSNAGKSCMDFSGTLQGVGANVEDLGKLNNEQLSNLASSYNGTYSSIAGLLADYGVRVDDAKVATQEAIDGMMGSIQLFDPQVSAAFVGAGVSTEEFVAKLANAGVSTEEFQALTADQLAQLVSSYDGNIDLTKAKLDKFVENNANAGTDAAGSLTGNMKTTIDETASQPISSIYAMKDGMLQAYDPATGKFSEMTAEAMKGIGDSVSSGSPGIASQVAAMKDGAIYAYNPVTGQFAQITGDAMKGVAGGVAGGRGRVVNETASLKNAATGAISPIKTELPNAATAASRGFGGNLASGHGTAVSNSNKMASAAAKMNAHSSDFYKWGSHSSDNFASGIRSGYQAAVSAATKIADAVKGILGHSVPKEGPLHNGGKGEIGWGEHAIQNFESGVRSQLPSLRKAMATASGIVATAMQSSEVARIGMSPANQPSTAGPNISVNVDAHGLDHNGVKSAVASAIVQTIGNKNIEVKLVADSREVARATRRIMKK